MAEKGEENVNNEFGDNSTFSDLKINENACNWRSKYSSTKEFIAFLYNNENYSDIILNVGENENEQTFYAHKIILGGRSAVFDKLLNEPNQTKRLTLPSDVSPVGIAALLQHIYCDKDVVTLGNVLSVLRVAKKYEVLSLQNQCERFLVNNIRIDNVFNRLFEARHFELVNLTKQCLEFIDKNVPTLFKDDIWLKIDLDRLCLILERDTLAAKEIDLFDFLMNWTKLQCQESKKEDTPENRRSIADRALNLVRFPLMTLDEFANGPVQTNLLDRDETIEIFKYFTVKPQPSTKFIARPRSNPGEVPKAAFDFSNFKISASNINHTILGTHPPADNGKSVFLVPLTTSSSSSFTIGSNNVPSFFGNTRKKQPF